MTGSPVASVSSVNSWTLWGQVWEFALPSVLMTLMRMEAEVLLWVMSASSAAWKLCGMQQVILALVFYYWPYAERPDNTTQQWNGLSYFILLGPKYSHVIDEDTKVWGGELTCLRSQQLMKWQSHNLNPGFDHSGVPWKPATPRAVMIISTHTHPQGPHISLWLLWWLTVRLQPHHRRPGPCLLATFTSSASKLECTF